MAEKEDLIRCRWHVDRTKEPCDYTVICLHPDYADMEVRLSSGDVTERVAKARLIEMMYREGEKRGIPARRILFKINGIEE